MALLPVPVRYDEPDDIAEYHNPGPGCDEQGGMPRYRITVAGREESS